MNAERPSAAHAAPPPRGTVPEQYALSRRILETAIAARSRVDFLREVSEMLLSFSRCDELELRTYEVGISYRYKARRIPAPAFELEILPGEALPAGGLEGAAVPESLIAESGGTAPRFFTGNGSVWTPDSLVVIPFCVDQSNRGLLVMKSARQAFFNQRSVELYEGLVQLLALALATRRARTALRERVKELTCLYGIARITSDPEVPFKEALGRIVQLLPPAWQFSESARARITLDGQSYAAPGFHEGACRQSAGIVVHGATRGRVEVCYVEERPELRLRPFLEEEEKLLNAVAHEVASLTLRHEHLEEKAVLENQLRHSDRLATIGQLAAGVAHELNEPLGAILGFAQLALKGPALPPQSTGDIERIVKASLHAREVVRKLMFFSRQIPPRTSCVDLNAVVNDGLYFLESSCSRNNVEIARILSSEPPVVEADVSQLQQVLVNLVVNAIHAMREGGKLTIRTFRDGGEAVLSVEDTGSGMTREIKEKIFTPFFTTKEVGQGTGLGLAVVHGIVRSHGGSIHVDSEPGRGSRFDVRLPAAGDAREEETDG